MTEEYNEYGEIKQERKLANHDEHRIHVTKDIFESNCSLCQLAAKKQASHWGNDE